MSRCVFYFLLAGWLLMVIPCVHQTSAQENEGMEWVDDFSADTSGSYTWKLAHHPVAIPGGEAYNQYHHDSRSYSFTRKVEKGKLTLTTDYWFLGRIYGYRPLHFPEPVKRIRIAANGFSMRGDNSKQKYPEWGLAVYATESDLMRDIAQYPGVPTHALIFTKGTQGYAQVLEKDLAEPVQDGIVVLMADDNWATCECPKSQVFAVFDQVAVRGGTVAAGGMESGTAGTGPAGRTAGSSAGSNGGNPYLVPLAAAIIIGGLLGGFMVLQSRKQVPPAGSAPRETAYQPVPPSPPGGASGLSRKGIPSCSLCGKSLTFVGNFMRKSIEHGHKVISLQRGALTEDSDLRAYDLWNGTVCSACLTIYCPDCRGGAGPGKCPRGCGQDVMPAMRFYMPWVFTEFSQAVPHGRETAVTGKTDTEASTAHFPDLSDKKFRAIRIFQVGTAPSDLPAYVSEVMGRIGISGPYLERIGIKPEVNIVETSPEMFSHLHNEGNIVADALIYGHKLGFTADVRKLRYVFFDDEYGKRCIYFLYEDHPDIS